MSSRERRANASARARELRERHHLDARQCHRVVAQQRTTRERRRSRGHPTAHYSLTQQRTTREQWRRQLREHHHLDAGELVQMLAHDEEQSLLLSEPMGNDKSQ